MSVVRREKQKQGKAESTTEEATAVLKADAEKRVKACAEEFKAMLEKHRCVGVIEFAGRGNQAQSQLIFVAQ